MRHVILLLLASSAAAGSACMRRTQPPPSPPKMPSANESYWTAWNAPSASAVGAIRLGSNVGI